MKTQLKRGGKGGEQQTLHLGRLILAKGYRLDWYRIIDLEADVPVGEYPLFDLYREHGRIVFQLYDACLGCDFTSSRSGIKDVGYACFMFLACKVEGALSATSLASALWDHKNDLV